MKALPLLLKIIGSFIAVVVIAVGVIVATVDPNDYRDEITDLVKKETGRDLQIKTLSLSLFPQIGLNLEGATLSNAKGFSHPYFVKVDTVHVGAAILPLLSQKLEIDTLTLHGLALYLEKDAKGVSNWDDLTTASSTADKKANKPTDSSDPLAKLASLNFGGIDILDATLHWTDKQANQTIRLELQDLTTGAITFGEFFTLSLNAQANIKNPEIKAQVALNIEAKLNRDGEYVLRNLTLKTTASGQGIPVEQATTELTIPTLDIQLAKQLIKLPAATLSYDVKGGATFPMKTIQGQLQVDGFTGDLASNIFRTNKLTAQTNLTGDNLPNSQLSSTITMQPSVNLTAGTASLNTLSLKTMNLTASGSVEVTQLNSDAIVNTKLTLAQTNLRALMSQLKIALPEMQDEKTLTQFAASLGLKFETKTEQLTVSNLAITLDESNLTGSASVRQFDRPNIRYDLALNKIDLNRYLPPKKATAEPATQTSKAEDTAIDLPVDLLRSLTLNGKLKIGSLKVDKLTPKNILLIVKGSKGKITASPIRADLFSTRLTATVGVDVRGKTQKFILKTDTKNLPIGQALIAVADFDKLSGTGALNANVRTSGHRVSQLKQNLNGTVSMNLKNGALKGINLAQSIREAQAKLSGKSVKNTNEPLQTDFSALIASFTIKQGVVTTKKLSALAPYMRINGSGTINLPKETLKYLVKTKIVGTDKGQGGQDLKELTGLTIPIKLTGRYTDPDISLDLNALLESKAKAELEKKKGAVVDDLKKQLKDSLFKGFGF